MWLKWRRYYNGISLSLNRIIWFMTSRNDVVRWNMTFDIYIFTHATRADGFNPSQFGNLFWRVWFTKRLRRIQCCVLISKKKISKSWYWRVYRSVKYKDAVFAYQYRILLFICLWMTFWTKHVLKNPHWPRFNVFDTCTYVVKIPIIWY